MSCGHSRYMKEECYNKVSKEDYSILIVCIEMEKDFIRYSLSTNGSSLNYAEN